MTIVVENALLGIASLGLAVAWIAAVLQMAAAAGATGAQGSRVSVLRRLFWGALLVALFAQTVVFAAASAERGTVAVYDQAEFLFAMSWVTGLTLAWFVRRGASGALVVAVLPVALLMLGGSLLAPAGSGEVRPGSLTSGWLLLHILTSIVAYAAFAVTFAAGAVTLVRYYVGGRSAAESADQAAPGTAACTTVESDGTPVERIGYQAAVFGFPFMTMVLLTGALWAKYVWGRYWAWDPIEAWALVTWLVYAVYLHAQYSRGWGGVRAAWLAVAGFACVGATYVFFTHLWF